VAFFFAVPEISASRRLSDLIALLLSRAGIGQSFFICNVFKKNVGRVMKHMCHMFWIDMSHMCYTCEM
jgi:hypothetical protein